MDKWLKKDLKFNWHPYTQMKDCAKIPSILIQRAKGIRLYDNKGNFYYDTLSSWWCNVHGHNHPVIKKAIQRQMDSLEHVLFAGFTHKPAILLAEKLISLMSNGLKRVFFSDNGSSAVEVALKMSFQYWKNTSKIKKSKFVSLDMGYHGDTIGTMSVGGVSLFNKTFSDILFSTFRVPSPYCYRCPMGKNRPDCAIECIEPLKRLLEEKSEEICAIIIEPMVLASSGMIVYPKEYLTKVAALAKKFRVHLIIDEVATGFGRTGKMFASEWALIEPDFICLAKGITGGYLPLAATLTTDEIYKAFYADYSEFKTFYHGHTYTANPLSCAAALASLKLFKDEDTLKRVNELIPFFHQRIEEFRDLALVGDARYIGLIAGLELVKDKKTKRGFSAQERIGLKAYTKGLRQNIILRPLGNVIYLFLPLCIKKKEINEVLKKTYSVINSL